MKNEMGYTFVILATFWRLFGDFLATFWRLFGDIFGDFLATFGDFFKNLPGRLSRDRS
jgi:hypothetical protein